MASHQRCTAIDWCKFFLLKLSKSFNFSSQPPEVSKESEPKNPIQGPDWMLSFLLEHQDEIKGYMVELYQEVKPELEAAVGTLNREKIEPLIDVTIQNVIYRLSSNPSGNGLTERNFSPATPLFQRLQKKYQSLEDTIRTREKSESEFNSDVRILSSTVMILYSQSFRKILSDKLQGNSVSEKTLDLG